MRSTTDVSSANLMMWLELNLAVQSWVSSVKSSGLSTQPCGAPVLSVVVLGVLWPTRTDRSSGYKVQDPVTEGVVKAHFMCSVVEIQLHCFNPLFPFFCYCFSFIQ